MQEQLFYDRLMRFPLFLGIGREDMLDILSRARLDFVRMQPATRVVSRGEPCRQLILLTGGTVTAAQEGTAGLRLTEEVEAPYIIELENIFGLTQRHTLTVTTVTTCSFIIIPRSELNRMAERSAILRINITNITATALQRLRHRLWQPPTATLRQRFTDFVQTRSLQAGGRKWLHCKMTDLGAILNVRRAEISEMLHQLQDEGLITIRRGKVEIHDTAGTLPGADN